MTVDVVARNIENTERRLTLNRYPDECPICHHNVEPKYLAVAHFVASRAELAFRCPRRDCQRIFIARYSELPGVATFQLSSVVPTTPVEPEQPEKVREMSPSFVEIYKQAAHADVISLGEIAGIGYRKSLEFLIKDFAIKQRPKDAEKIKKQFLGSCIDDYIDDANVKQAAKRATWLGNDEAHYVRKWETQDLRDLKVLIRLVRNAIDNVLLTEHYSKSMPDPKAGS